MKFKRNRFVFMIVIAVLAGFFVCQDFGIVSYADTDRGVLSKNEDLVNYGNEFKKMKDTLPLEVYQALKGINTQTDEIRVNFKTSFELKGETPQDLSIQNAELFRRVSNAVQIALDAFEMDYPEIFWLEIGQSVQTLTLERQEYPDGSVEFTLKGVKIRLGKNMQDPDQLNRAYDAVFEKLSKCVNSAEGLTVPEKLKKFHDYLCANIVYDLNAEQGHNLYGGLVKGRCVCEGYAESFKALCDMADIPCVSVVGAADSGENHMWNYCMLDDGKWYAVDVTWDDQSEIMTDFFLSGADTVSKRVTGKRFTESHIKNGDFSSTGIHVFTYPELSRRGYYEGAAQMGDVDGNGVVDAADALNVLKAAAKLSVLDTDAATSADVDQNGNIDANDALQILKYAAKLIDDFDQAA